MNFEQKMKRLEDIAAQIRESRVDFPEQLALFKEGSHLASEVEKELAEAEQIIQEIKASEPEDPENPPL